MFRRLLLICPAALATFARGQTQITLNGVLFSEVKTKHAITSELSEFVTDLLQSSTIPGISLGVVHTSSGERPDIELKSWGRMTEDDDKLSPDALFEIGSCSKAFLASAVGILIDDFAQGRDVTPLPAGVTTFDWQTKLKDLLPDEWALEDEWASEKANIRDALSHVTGMPRHDYSYAPGDTPAGLVKNLRNLRPAYELRQKWSYNNQMFTTGAYLISKYAGKSYIEFATERLLAPMNMSHTTFWSSEAREAGLLTQAWTKFGRLIPFWFDDADVVKLMAGAGGIISSAEEMTKWLTVLLNGGVEPNSNTTIIPPSAFEEITTAHSIVTGKPATPEMSIVGYGLGWERSSYQGHDVITHSGALPGFSTSVAFLPHDGLGIVVLANADAKDAANEAIVLRIVEDVLGLKRVDRSVSADPSGKAVLKEHLEAPHEGSRGDHTVALEPLPIDLDSFSGTYTNPGYGTLIFCMTESTSQHCLTVLSSFAPFIYQTPSPSPTKPELYTAWPRIWSTHMRLTHTTGAEFGLQFTAQFPEGYGRNGTAFQTSEPGDREGRAVFVLEQEGDTAKVLGFGMEIDGEAVEARKRAGARDVREWADAWFEKV
ncbi:beta-lactamase/transpeptidase-like protein [Daedalea quercina L-15889]|uniref:Beta-lactamase/transpeptidase-like protein n=1 Tax=Daedalea quercina L-15889 TaxID=1314783 RepID=A0A165QFL9_9APHY|nr:beta-lactamase/transpeptidase-like protein [Daedalea quercina L-15889]